MSADDVPTTYRLLLRAYPRSFRERFGPEMAQLFLDRRRDGARGVDLVLHEAVDVLRTAPRLHLESPMSRKVFLAILVAITIFSTLAGGPAGLILAALLVVAIVGLRSERPVEPPTGRWWRWFAAAAVSVLVLFAVLAIEGDELTGVGWTLAFLSGNGAIVLVVIGIGDALLNLVQRHRANPA